ncbi:MAG: hypothetical protein J6Y43_00745 [Clostridia bacterium]|nr:hypothetical protein [Clostridia bacterium]
MFSKKILVIKQTTEGIPSVNKPACGICRLEKENDFLTVFLSPVGFAALDKGEYRLFIVGDDKIVVKKDLGKIPVSSALPIISGLSPEKGVSAGLWTVENDIPLLIAYGKSEDAALSVKEYGATVINEIIAERKLREREKEFALPPDTAETETATDTAASEKRDGYPQLFRLYDDEAVATENYYDENRDVQRKLSAIRELSDEYIRRESDGGNSFRPQKERQGEKDLDLSQNETGDKRSENAPYYLTVKSELDGIFDKYPKESALENAIGGSRFAKIYYADEKYYVVGVIKENGKEKYICYGVPSRYRPTPPKELAGYCCFVPLSVFDLKGDGYFMMFQDACTGKCVHKG